MKRFSLLVTFLSALILHQYVTGQESAKSGQYSNWEFFDEAYIDYPDRLINNEKAAFGLSDYEELILSSKKKDRFDIEHLKFQQFYSNVEVEGGEYILHISKDKIWGNGRIVYGINCPAVPLLTEEMALKQALDHVDADKYFWEDESKEELVKHLKGDPNASFYPKGKLIIGEEKHSQDGSGYSLLWKFEIYAFREMALEYVYVNAIDGSIQYTVSGMHSESVEGTAVTRYHGEQTIITDSVSADQYHLVDATRGGGIEIYDLNQSEDLEDAIHFVDEDNYWDNDNDDLDNAAGDVHWGLEMVYDYYLSQHGRDSYDGNGSPIIAYVHYGNNVFNAFWVGLYGAFGDGDGNPLTYIDVIAHEYTHGVTKTSAGLIYSYETGALNESFSDILGTAIEFYAFPDSASWSVGILDFEFRDMENPNLYGQPDTYEGSFWYSGGADYGGVHTNSGVQNYWYYLLSEGGSGTNDNGDDFNVESIGIESATAIAYRTLTTYLTTTSVYNDARQGTIQSAIDIFGECSNEVEQVINAWNAVGLGPEDYTKDLEMVAIESPLNNCDLSDEEIVAVSIKYNSSGCNAPLLAGTSIEMMYQLDEADPVIENFVLSEDLNEGDVVTYSFAQSISLPEMATEYELSVWVNFSDDAFPNNNDILEYEIERKYDFGDGIMGFESFNSSIDSMYIVKGKHADAKISNLADNTGTKGFMFTAKQTTQYLVNFADHPDSNFVQNREYVGKLCFCVDAQEWDNVNLLFDMKQTHAMHYLLSWGNDSTEYASSMRMLINGEQFGEQFHPNTYSDDPYLTYSYNLDQLAGTYFEFCFESKNFLNTYSDPVSGSDGDNTYLDNVYFYQEGANFINEIEEATLTAYPNPSSDKLTVQFKQSEKGELNLVNAQGKIVLKQTFENKKKLSVDVSNLAPGLYTLYCYLNEERISLKVSVN